MKRTLVASLCLAAAAAALCAEGKGGAEEAAFLELFDPVRTDFTAPLAASFLAQVPAAAVRDIVRQYAGGLGRLLSAEPAGDGYRLVFDKGTAPARIHLDAAGRIDSLWFGAPEPRDDDAGRVREAFAALRGTVSVCVVRDGTETVFSMEPDRPLAVGSAFKLYVLEALQERIRRGAASWSDVISLRDSWKSFPSGILQDWPGDAPVTLSTLASLMVSMSDNTATDHLLYWLGRDAVEAEAPDHGFPFLSTREMFLLKWGLSRERREAYVRATAAERRRILAGMASSGPGTVKMTQEPVAVDAVEWFFTTRELCGAIRDVGSLPLLGINPGLAQRDAWSLAAFKGGSEPGVLNYTHLLRKAPGGPAYAVSATINDGTAPVDTAGFSNAVKRLIALIADGKL